MVRLFKNPVSTDHYAVIPLHPQNLGFEHKPGIKTRQNIVNYLFIVVYLQHLCYNIYMKSRKIFNRINALRHEKGISRRTLAQKIGVNFQTVGYLERQEYNPSLDLAFRISEYFRLPIEFIFSVEPLQPMSQEIVKMSKKGGGRNG